MLLAPFTELPYRPTVDSLLAGIDTEYKDNFFREELLKLDPNSTADRQIIIKNYIIKEQEYLSYRHKFLLLKKLEEALADKLYDFGALFEYDYEANESSASPWLASGIHTPRSFFEDIYELASEEWKQDINKAALEDPSTW
ncbi:hypothetical protein FBY06_1372 [Pseudomonas sp. SJZ085]|uniref:hypothetical protein n=1 Tax=unclassified Pseudomonas TaxID=196821 RepID=UPI00119A454F|nr:MULTISPECIES: hypothetical protein [unclassified Pseudomonas]TWC12576.1 hypothetical protein FBX99_1362 [Pseudomonas sp. SJZ074]TWC31020.1 hypothetical protein FBY06_1372 [Pseudomonas sp. SJZ085]